MAICRVCLNESDRLISLTVGDGAEQELQMLSQFMNPNIKYQSNYICLKCMRKLEVTMNFKMQCEKSFAAIGHGRAVPIDPLAIGSEQIEEKDPLDPFPEKNLPVSKSHAIGKCELIQQKDPLEPFPDHTNLDAESSEDDCVIVEQEDPLLQPVENHINLATDKKIDNKCHLCGKSFAVAQYLKQHLKLHDKNKKQFDCSRCNLKFLSSAHFKQHMTAKH